MVVSSKLFLKRHLRLLLTLSSVLSIMISGCGAGNDRLSKESSESQRTTDQPRGRAASFNPIGDLLTQVDSGIKSVQESSSEANAAVRFLILHQQPLAVDEETQAKLTQLHFKRTSELLAKGGINSLIRSKLINRFTVTSAAMTDELPINLDVFTPIAERQKLDLSALQGLVFVSYQGQALHKGLQLQVSCGVTQTVAESELLSSRKVAPLIVSLPTFEIFELPDFVTKCSDPQESWVRPAAELVQDQVRLISRGMNQWGRPELELGPLPRSEAPKLYPLFMTALTQLRNQPFTDQKNIMINKEDVSLGECQRPAHHYDLSCRRLSLTSGQSPTSP